MILISPPLGRLKVSPYDQMANGLFACFPGNGRAYDATGRRAANVTGNLTYTKSWLPFGSVITPNWDGVDDDVDVGTIPFLADFSLLAWMYFGATGVDGYRSAIRVGQVFGTNANYVFGYRDNAGNGSTYSVFCYARNSGTLKGSEFAGSTTVSGWHRIGVSWTSGSQRYFLDGKLLGTGTSTNGADGGGPLSFGGISDSSNNVRTNKPTFDCRVYNRVLTDKEFAADYAKPNGIYLPPIKPLQILWNKIVGAYDLAGAAAAQASASGTLTTQVPLVGAATSVATASGALTTQVPLAGQAAAVSLASGSLSITVALSGAALANALASGALSTSIALSGSALANILATGNLLGSGAGALAGNAVAQAAASGALSTAIPLQGSASALAIATGGLTTAVPLAGVAVAVSHVTGDLTVTVSGLSGAAVAQVLASGTLSLQIALSGAAVAHALALGGLVDAAAIPMLQQSGIDRIVGVYTTDRKSAASNAIRSCRVTTREVPVVVRHRRS